jgi:hypothetical protein
MKRDEVIEGVVQSLSKTATHVDLAMVTFYHPCDKKSIRIDEITFVMVVDRQGIPF